MVGMTIVACGDQHLGGANLLQDRDQADGGGLLFLSQPAIAEPEKPRSMRTDPEHVERGDLFRGLGARQARPRRVCPGWRARRR